MRPPGCGGWARCLRGGAVHTPPAGPEPRLRPHFAAVLGPAGFCEAPRDLPFAEPTATGPESTFPVGTALSYRCRPGYSGDDFSITCLQSRAWSGAEGRCHRRSCGAPPEPRNGVARLNTDTRFGAKVDYSCNEGFRLRGARTAACLLSGSDVAWDPEAPSCERIFCAAPPAIEHGTHSGDAGQDFPYGAAVTYTCDPPPLGGPAWELRGAPTLRCTSDQHGLGVWRGTAPRCEPTGPAVCPQLPETPHGQLLDPYGPPHQPGMAVTVTCDPGYLLVGDAFVFCTNEGTWSSLTHLCQEVNCSLPPLEGARKELEAGRAYRPGDSVKVACEDGYTLQGSPRSQCQAGGSWAPPLAACTPRPWAALLTGVLLALLAFVLLPAAGSCWVIAKRRKRKGAANDDGPGRMATPLGPVHGGGAEAEAGHKPGSPRAIP